MVNIKPDVQKEEKRERSRTVGKSTNQLDGDHQDGFERESPVTQVEEVLQAGPQQFQHHGVVLPTWTEVEYLGQALCWWAGGEQVSEPGQKTTVNIGGTTWCGQP